VAQPARRFDAVFFPAVFLAGAFFAVFLAVPVLATAHRLVGAAGAGTEAGEEAVEEMIEATEGDVVHGHIRRAGGAPVAGAALTLIDHDGHQIARGTSGPDGYYTIIGRRSGAHVLIVSAAGYRPEACPVVLTGGAVEVPVVLTGGVALRGTVAVADGGPPGTGGRPAAGAAVTLVDPGGQVIERQRTGQDGRYLFHAVPSGAYTLAVSMARCQPAVRAITVPAAGTVTADVTLAPHGPVDGLIRARQDGRPLRDALVTLLDASGTIVATTVTGADGRYRVPGVPEGDYTLIASGYPPVRATLRLTAGAQVTCDLTLGYAAGRAGGSDSSQPGGAPPERNGHHGGEGAGWDGHEGRDGHGGTGA
jgi:5-hydroxyisourate hydrolase-like protein (transthyretin family)